MKRLFTFKLQVILFVVILVTIYVILSFNFMINVPHQSQGLSGIESSNGNDSIYSKSVYPVEQWDVVPSPEEIGWSIEKLDAAREYADKIGSDVVLIIYKGRIIAQWGDITKVYPVYSMRKSFLSALIGVAVAKNQINLDATLEVLSIDDIEPPLSDREKQARVRDLLTSRSGVYHKAAYESRSYAKIRPERHSHTPGTFFYYNNWDFNTLCTIFEQQTDEKIFEAFKKHIADVIGMEDYHLENTEYYYENSSIHPAYLFHMSARDLARFGVLYLNKGMWLNREVISQTWVIESVQTHVPEGAQPFSGYGYMWWTHPRSGLLFSASGKGAQKIVVWPEKEIVLVHLDEVGIFGGIFGNIIDNRDFWRLPGMIIQASPK